MSGLEPTPSAGVSKRSTCRDCQRHVDVIRHDDDTITVLDTEVRSAVVYPNGREKITVRLLHAAVCKGPPATRPQPRPSARSRKVRR